ncbi:TIGR01777 family oxidoreductase [Chitinophagaceae bacterium LWZ2-11]
MRTILITGGTGMVGKQLTQLLLAKGYRVIILTRNIKDKKNKESSALQYALWNVEQQTIDRDAIIAADAIIHLAGENVAEQRWTDKRKQEIVNSRTQSSSLLVKALQEIPNNIHVVVSASAIGWYGEDKPGVISFTEDMPHDNSFLGTTCEAWEKSIEPVVNMDKRLVKLRTGIVLDKAGGVIKEFKKPLHFRVAGVLGKGDQIMSWIHVDDLCRMYVYALEQSEIRGVYNAVAPNPVSNRALTLAIANRMYGNVYLPLHIPVFILKVMLGEMSIEVLKGTTVSCNKILEAGFTFQFTNVNDAVSDLIK